MTLFLASTLIFVSPFKMTEILQSSQQGSEKVHLYVMTTPFNVKAPTRCVTPPRAALAPPPMQVCPIDTGMNASSGETFCAWRVLPRLFAHSYSLSAPTWTGVSLLLGMKNGGDSRPSTSLGWESSDESSDDERDRVDKVRKHLSKCEWHHRRGTVPVESYLDHAQREQPTFPGTRLVG